MIKLYSRNYPDLGQISEKTFFYFSKSLLRNKKTQMKCKTENIYRKTFYICFIRYFCNKVVEHFVIAGGIG